MRKNVTLEDKYTEKSGRIYLNGMQALVRIPIMQRWLDTSRNLKTAAFISGYRGSPIGAIDLTLGQAKKYLDENDIKFVPGINEDLGATAVWGTQQLNLNPKDAQYDGVTGIWYGKGPGVDRSTDAIKHASAAGTSKLGGVLALVGDDHACKSSTFPHQSEQAFAHIMAPLLHPAGLGDTMELGLHGIAMSRYCGSWVGLKIVSEFADSSASVFSDPFSMEFKTPQDFDMPEDGLNIRWYDAPIDQEKRLVNFKLAAAQAYARANGLDKYITNPKEKRFAIVTTGKAYLDTMQALEEIGISKEKAEDLGIVIYKVALVWPLEEEGIKKLAGEVDEILVIEEKRNFIEDQIKHILFNLDKNNRPLVIGKKDKNNVPLVSQTYELSPTEIADILIIRLAKYMEVKKLNDKIIIIHKSSKLSKIPSPVVRMPWYCSGCPHNSSTIVPEGSRAFAGIGCHYMAMWMDRRTVMFTHMGGEGVTWIGQSPYTKEKHVFANLGDGTYFHSGILAIRASVSAKVNITYKILYNDAVAMTGGQHVDGPLSVEILARQVFAEGVKAIYVVSDDPDKYPSNVDFPTGTKIFHRDEMTRIQLELREIEGTSILIYDQTCAAELRRRRKRKLAPDPAKHIIINERICEGCGDCGEQSNCLSIMPIETEFGRKRQIDQSSCNKDYSCVKGFCPAIVTVIGGNLKKPQTAEVSPKLQEFFKDMLEPKISELKKPESILVTGVGGTGIVTIGAIIAMAAHLEDKGCTTMDQTGLAQKGGSVTSHIRIAKTPQDLSTVRINAGGANAILGGDILVTADGSTLSKIRNGQTKVILNTNKAPTGEFTHNTEWEIPQNKIVNNISNICGRDNLFVVGATKIATKLLGNSIATNMFILGYAYQKGLIPIHQEAIMRAIELNAIAVKMNQQAFTWGRRAVFNLEKIEEIIASGSNNNDIFLHRKISKNIDEVIKRRVKSLNEYQNSSYANKYLKFINKVMKIDKNLNGKSGKLTESVAKYYYKLMAYKDEYEVARLYTDGQFIAQLDDIFEGDLKLKYNLAPPLIASHDKETGYLKKAEFGSWLFPIFKILARLKFLRGTVFDIFGYSAEHRADRNLIKDYKNNIKTLLAALSKDNYDIAVEIASIPEYIRGYGHVKISYLEKSAKKEAELFKKFKEL